MWSRIHAELGLSPTPLTHDLVLQAVALRMRESEDLDWKRDLPPDAEKKKWEFAKDVAAMANTRGGLIVFGVREENEEAAELTGVLNGERDRQRLRALAWQRIKPLINGLTIEPLSNEVGEQGLIIVSVPASPDSPYVVGEKNEMGVPYRDGSDTRWMAEWQLERAYHDRLARRADDRAALSLLINDLVPELRLQNGVWVGVSARPVAPIPPAADCPTREQATATLNEMLRLANEVWAPDTGRMRVISALDHSAVGNPRNGLRRWVIQPNPFSENPAALADWSHVELHHDGAVALAVRIGRWLPDKESKEFYRIPVVEVDSLLVEAVALAAAHLRSLGGSGTMLIRAMFLQDSTTPRRPLVAVDNRMGHLVMQAFDVVSGTRAVHNPQAVKAQFSADDDVVALRHASRQLADDLDHQFGMPTSSIPGRP